jgi:hypothetical protein
MAIVYSTVVYLLLCINDAEQYWNTGTRSQFWITFAIRCAACVIGIIGYIALGPSNISSSSTESGNGTSRQSLASTCTCIVWCRQRQLMQPIMAMVATSFALAQLAVGALEERYRTDPVYAMVLLLIGSTSSTFFRQRFFASLYVNLFIIIAFTIVTLTQNNDADADEVDSLLTGLGLLASNLIFAVQAYNRELVVRRAFLAQRQLELEEQKSQLLLEKMLPPSIISKLRGGADFIYSRHCKFTVIDQQ